MRRALRRLLIVAAAAASLASGYTGTSASRAASGGSCRWQAAAVEDPHAHLFDRFNSVTATASGKAWAVGGYYSGREGGPNGAFIEEWTGRRWQLVGRPMPNVSLWSVSASGPHDAWTVGDHLVEHWNGRSWRRVATAQVQGNILWGVAARKPRDAWLVGERWRGEHKDGKTLAERWDGSRWRVVPTPNPHASGHRYDAILQAVSVRSASDAWAVGYWLSGHHMLVSRTLIEHWDGRRWRIVPSPNAHASNGVLYDILFAVIADRAGDAWAVGSYESHAGGYGGGGEHALVLHWNGRRWSRASLPPSRERTFLHGVVAGAGGAWAVGDRGLPPHHHRTLIERWNGTRWTVAQSPRGFDLAAVSAAGPGGAWAVGAAGRRPLAAQLECGQSAKGVRRAWQRLRDARVGVSVRYPPGWHAAVLAPDGDLVVSSRPIPDGSGAALSKLVTKITPASATIVVYPNGVLPSSVASRPARLRLDRRHFSSFEGFGPSYRFDFRQDGRVILAFVKLGLRASARTRAKAESVLNSLRFASLTRREQTIHLPGPPSDVIYGKGSVWVTSEGPGRRGSLLRLDPATGRVLARIPLPGISDYSQLALAAGSVWVTDSGRDLVYRVDPGRRAVTATIHVQGPPLGIAAGAGSLWVAVPGQTSGQGSVLQRGRVLRIDPATARVVGRLRTSAGVGPVAYAGGSVWLLNTSGPGQTLQRINPTTNRFMDRLPPDLNSSFIVSFAATSRYVWLGYRDEEVSRYDTRTRRQGSTISSGGNAIGAYRNVAFGVGPEGGGSSRDIATQLDTHSSEAAPVYPVGHTPVAVAVGPRYAWIANFHDSTLTRITYH